MSLILDQVDAGVLGGVVINAYDRFSKLLNGINIVIGKIHSNDSDLLHIDGYKEVEIALGEAENMLPYVGGSSPMLVNAYNSTVANALTVGIYAPSASREVSHEDGERTGTTVSVAGTTYQSPSSSGELQELLITNTTPAPAQQDYSSANNSPFSSGAGLLILGALALFLGAKKW